MFLKTTLIGAEGAPDRPRTAREPHAPGAEINSQVKKEKINEGIIYNSRNYNMKGNIILFESKDVIL